MEGRVLWSLREIFYQHETARSSTHLSYDCSWTKKVWCDLLPPKFGPKASQEGNTDVVAVTPWINVVLRNLIPPSPLPIHGLVSNSLHRVKLKRAAVPVSYHLRMLAAFVCTGRNSDNKKQGTRHFLCKAQPSSLLDTPFL